MSIRTPRTTCNDRMQRKRNAPGNRIDERVHKYLKSMSDADCISIDPLDSQTDVPHREHHERSGRSESAPSVHQRRSQEEDSDNPFLYTASEQDDTSLTDGGDKLAQARGGCSKTHKPSKDLDIPDVIVGPLTKRTLHQLNNMNRSFLSESSPSMTSGAGSALPESLVLEETKGTINPYSHEYHDALSKRGIGLANDAVDKMPSNFGALKKALRKKRSDSGPDDTEARHLRTLMVDNANNKPAIMQKILPTIVPVGALDADDANYTVPQQQWSRKIMIAANAKPALTAVKPDMTIGWSKAVFTQRKAVGHLGAHACPVVAYSELAFPLFTVEVQGDRGSLRVARLQNLHNGATLLSNLWHIRQYYNKEREDEFFNKVHALSLQLTPESIQLSCYWAARRENGQIMFYGTQVRTWSPFEDDRFNKAYRYTCNALEWVKNQAFDWICSALARLERCLDTSVPTPPRTQFNYGNTKRTRSLTSEPNLGKAPSKKLGSKKKRVFGAGDQEAEAEIGTSEDILAATALGTGEIVFGS